MEELIKRLERVIATGAPDKDGQHPISAEAVLEVVRELSEHGTNLAEVGTDCISRQAAIDALENTKTAISENGERYIAKQNAIMRIDALPSAQSEIIRCKDCKWYGRADKRRFYRGMDCLQKRIDTIVPDKDFCSRAERRTDG